jgi:hypothetical protein
MGYLPFPFVAFHLLFGASGPKPKINWPSVQYETSTKIQKSNNLVDSMIADMSPSSRIFASPLTLVGYYFHCKIELEFNSFHKILRSILF